MITGISMPKLGQVSHELRKAARFEIAAGTPANEHRITLLLQGDGGGQTGSVSIVADRPIVWLTIAGTEERLNLSGQIDAWSFTFQWADFQATSLGDSELQLSCFGKSRQTRLLKQVDTTDASRMVDIYKNLQRAAGRWEMTGDLEICSYVLLLIAFYTDLPEVPSTSGIHRKLEQFHVLLDERAFEPVSIKVLAEQTDMSPEYLRHLFYQRFGVQPHAYRASLRMARARQLFADPKMSVKEVAHLVGYDDPLYFSRVFKKRYGLAPSDLMRQARGPSAGADREDQGAWNQGGHMDF